MKCKICNKEFKNKRSFIQHLWQFHDVKFYDYIIHICKIKHPICRYCKENLVKFDRAKFNKYCSQSCAHKSSREYMRQYYIKHPEEVIKLSEKITIIKNEPKTKLKISETSKRIWSAKTDAEKLIQMGGIKDKESKSQNEVQEFIESLGITCDKNYRKLGFEIDIFVPDYNIGIEYHGLYWHSKWAGNKSSGYHKNKMIECEKNGIRLIQIFDDEWQNKQDILKSKLKNIFNKNTNIEKIYARNCVVKEVKDNKIVYEFYNNNHIQGQMYGDVSLGLYYNDVLVSMVSFIHSKLYREKDDTIFELNRFATNINYRVVGGFGKLLKYFTKYYAPKKIYSFADLRYVSVKDNVYKTLGFNLIKILKPDYQYTNYKKRIMKYSFSKSNLRIKFPETYSDQKSEWQIMKELGYDIVWDCGKLKYELIPIA